MPDPVVSRERRGRKASPYPVRFVTRPTVPQVSPREIVVWQDSSAGTIHFLMRTVSGDLYRFDGSLVT